MGMVAHPSEVAAKPALRLAYLVSHPIQYQAPLLRRIAQEPDIDLTVFFGSDFSLRAYRDQGFAVDVAWDVPLVNGYRHEFLPRLRDTSTVSVASPLNYGILGRLRGRAGAPGFDALWVHGYATVNSIHGILAANALGIPVLLRADMWLGDRARSALKRGLKRAFMTCLHPLIAAVLPIGTRNAAYWSHSFGDGPDGVPQFFMPYAVDNAYFADRARAAQATRSALQAELGLDPARPVILFASKLQERKHCDHLIAAYAQLARDLGGGQGGASGCARTPCLVVVGDGEQRAALEVQAAATGLAAGSIVFAGFRNQSELPRFFDLATVFVLPARHEPWGLVVNEVMNARRAIIVSDDVGCAPDLVHEGDNGLIYPVGDVIGLTRALRQVLASPDAAHSMGQRSYDLIQSWSFEQDVRALRAALAYVVPRFVA